MTESQSLATVLVAMLDGIVLHRLIDAELGLTDVAQVIARLRLQ